MKNPDHFTVPQQIILGAIALLATPEQWTQNSSAIDHNGVPTDPEGLRAVGWCMMGAIQCAASRVLFSRTPSMDNWAVSAVLTAVSAAIDGRHIPTWNDSRHRTHSEVRNALLRSLTYLHHEQAETPRPAVTMSVGTIFYPTTAKAITYTVADQPVLAPWPWNKAIEFA